MVCSGPIIGEQITHAHPENNKNGAHPLTIL